MVSTVELARRLTQIIIAVTIVVAAALTGEGAAHAMGTYVECPDLRPGAACGFQGAVGPGNLVATFRYRKADGSYGSEFYAQACRQATCSVELVEVARPDRTPAGYEISSDSILTVFVRFP